MNKEINHTGKMPRSKIYFPKVIDVIKVVILVIITTAISSGFFYGVSLLSSKAITEIIKFLI